jgi:hypothetical protein
MEFNFELGCNNITIQLPLRVLSLFHYYELPALNVMLFRTEALTLRTNAFWSSFSLFLSSPVLVTLPNGSTGHPFSDAAS